MEVVVIDGQGGGLGRAIVEALKASKLNCIVIGVGTNSIATSNLRKGGADFVATGENAIMYNAKNANIIIGPIGIAFSNSMYGEISPAMAHAINESEATKYLLPISKCSAKIIGTTQKPMNEYIQELIEILEKRMK
ncbi:DUF3842 family protein [Tannockella kyphosi]|uniref:DUF3842 family protein n=1 Tax=Tannockella kyphosi TaxID=2899121 RepID=UPI0020130085|nr:DUF3842 family protein [Tannockella kyphosi]